MDAKQVAEKMIHKILKDSIAQIRFELAVATTSDSEDNSLWERYVWNSLHGGDYTSEKWKSFYLSRY